MSNSGTGNGPAWSANDLVGRFHLLFADTTASAEAPAANGYSELTLGIPDSAARARASMRGIGFNPRKNLQLVGRVRATGFARPDTAEFDDGVLYLGCRDCTDASPDRLLVEEVSARGARGRWSNRQSGIAVRANSKGERLADPGGYFCAIRL